jgi:hypothetical protein
MASRRVLIRHWFPIVTFCPVNHLPDLIYIEVEFDDQSVEELPVHELYGIRRKIRAIAAWRKMYMEDICDLVFNAFPGCTAVTVTLALGRHVVTRYED